MDGFIYVFFPTWMLHYTLWSLSDTVSCGPTIKKCYWWVWSHSICNKEHRNRSILLTERNTSGAKALPGQTSDLVSVITSVQAEGLLFCWSGAFRCALTRCRNLPASLPRSQTMQSSEKVGKTQELHLRLYRPHLIC